MRLTIDGLKQQDDFARKDIKLPPFDIATMQSRGREEPRWVHIGAGNIFRVYLARLAHELIADGHHWPITAVAPRDPSKLESQLTAYDHMTLGVTLCEDGTRDLQVIAGISEGLAAQREEDDKRLVNIISQPQVALISLTITEKGYVLHDASGVLLESIQHIIDSNPRSIHAHTMGLVARLLLERFEAGAFPISLLSFDNFKHNGDKLRESVLTIIEGWKNKGSVTDGFYQWVKDSSLVAFPVSVIDKITPRPSQSISTLLTEYGFDDMGIQTVGGTAVSGFVNTEPAEYLIIEDTFAGERPPLTEYGVHFSTRQVCDDFEKMKVTTCLNPLHTALAISGCLLRFPTIDSEMRDADLARFIHRLGWDEGMPVVTDPGIIKPDDFLREVETVRFPNPYLPDDPARIAMDTSQKIPIRFGETVKEYTRHGLDMDLLIAIPLVFALWCRYLMGIADDGEPFNVSSDPLLDELQGHVSDFKLGHVNNSEDVHTALSPLLSNPTIFGVNLYDTPLAKKVEDLFIQLCAAPGAVRETISKEMKRS